ncbi:jacalin-related lectin 19 isoform X1 [Brachypodium distachyon]|uniref:Jacalin-type lectin domain-containing protein n=2 Tax=Brachypodium distachyon TaxID=15368 RepID=A0A2K2D2E8_BRADI|nr:jacalin-related lectin 19 isoform X1 [Brachypodium distachyon]PNT68464.1 hypothetical protein BRADI_3g40855v3 [Brachypodium distachyon]|eukprot:XP_024317368.1 jacalin-related lectin 19 isoform X1 [Brachypodium distachyon]
MLLANQSCPYSYSLDLQEGSSSVVLRMGPCGGGGGEGGEARDMDTRGVERVVKVAVRHGEDTGIDAISVLYEREGGRHEWTDLWGGPGGSLAEICLRDPDEHFTSVTGHYGDLDGGLSVVRSLTFVSNRRSFGPFGKEEGVPFALPACGGRILGFHARSGTHLHAIGTYVRTMTTMHGGSFH